MSWHVIRTKPNRELSVNLLLCTRWNCYLPLYTAARDRRRPLFPGYLLAEFEWERHHEVLATPGVLAGNGGILRVRDRRGMLQPYVISAEELEYIRALEAAGAVPSRAHYRCGESVEVRVRNLRMFGRFERAEGERAHVVVEILGREVSLVADMADVRRVA